MRRYDYYFSDKVNPDYYSMDLVDEWMTSEEDYITAMNSIEDDDNQLWVLTAELDHTQCYCSDALPWADMVDTAWKKFGTELACVMLEPEFYKKPGVYISGEDGCSYTWDPVA